MNRIRSLFLLSILLFAAPNSLFAATPSPSMQSILQDRLLGKYALKLNGLIKTNWTAADVAAAKKDYSIELYRLPYPHNVSDYIRYSIYRFRTVPKFLVVRSGGRGGLFEVYTSPVR